MKLNAVQDWIVSAEGLGEEFTDLRTWSVSRTFDDAIVRERSLDAERKSRLEAPSLGR